MKIDRFKNYENLVRAAVLVSPESIPLPCKYVVDTRIAKLKNGGARPVSRPRFDKWGLVFQVLVGDDRLNPDTLQEMLIAAGHYGGLGTYRPEFGRFEVTKFKVVNGAK